MNIDAARAVHPRDFLPPGAKITSSGAAGNMEVLVAGETWRITSSRSDGCPIAFRGNEKPIDSIALYSEWYGCGFSDAVRALGGDTRAPRQAAMPISVQKASPAPGGPDAPAAPDPEFTLREQRESYRTAGRDYLKRVRGISHHVIDHAERLGAIQYEERGPVFVGRDRMGQPRSADVRLLRPFKTPSGKLIKSLAYRGSQKNHFPIVLPGSEKTVLVVEGGIDALAAHELARRGDKEAPTVIATGGARISQCLKTEHIAEILGRAETVTICCERERNERVQAETDAGHERQAEVIRQVAPGAEVKMWMPPLLHKDLGDMTRDDEYGRLKNEAKERGFERLR